MVIDYNTVSAKSVEENIHLIFLKKESNPDLHDINDYMVVKADKFLEYLQKLQPEVFSEEEIDLLISILTPMKGPHYVAIEENIYDDGYDQLELIALGYLNNGTLTLTEK